MRAVVRIRLEPHYRRAAFESGLKRVGFVLTGEIQPRGPEDWLVIWNRKRGGEEQAANAWEQRGGTVIVAENGYLAKTEKTHYAISVHGHNGSGWFPVGDEDRFTPLGFEVKLPRVGGYEIVVRAQRGIGSMMMASPPGWAEKTACKLRTLTKMPVRVIQHPGNFKPRVPPTIDLSDTVLFVTWCSAMGVLALVEGIPCWYGAPRWVCSEAANRFPTGLSLLSDVARPTEHQRKAALHKMSHGQWRHEEIATGEPFARIIERRGEATW
jgi:hypothetical protein